MEIINSSDNYQKATWLDTEFPTLIIDDFINNQEGEKLTRDGKIFIKSEVKNNMVVHGGKVLILRAKLEYVDSTLFNNNLLILVS